MTWTVQQIAIFSWFVAAAVSKVAQALVVRARAGTGKTTSIVEAIRRYVAAAREAGRRVTVLVCAFNKVIADELTHRFSGTPGIEARTLHSLGNWYVMKALGRRRPRQIDSGKGRARYLAAKAAPKAPDDALALIADLNHKAREIEPLATCGEDLVDLAYQFDLVPDTDLVSQGWDLRAICDAAFQAMRIGAGDFTSMDFADMIYWPLVNGWVFPRFDMTVVDEAQDMTMAQLELALRATYENGKVVIVGDDRQAIYGFRGADSGSLDRLKSELRAEELGLTVTHRCGRKIVEMAQKLVPDYEAAEGAHEGAIADSTIDRMLADVGPGDYILSRTNAPLASLCLTLIREGKRAYIRGREIGQGLVSIVRKLRVKEMADLNAKLVAWRNREIERITNGTQDAERAAQQADLVRDKADAILALADGCVTVAELIARIEAMFETPKPGAPETRIMLSTVHRAKGLESSNVYLIERTFKRRGGEENNLRYVALTRAKHNLYLVQDEPQP